MAILAVCTQVALGIVTRKSPISNYGVFLEVGQSFNPRPAGVFGERAPLRGRGADSALCLTPERMVVERREKRQTKALNKKNLRNTKKLLKEVRGQVRDRVRSKVKTTGFPMIGFRAQLAQR